VQGINWLRIKKIAKEVIMKHRDSSVIKVKSSETCEKSFEEELSDIDAWRCEACGHIDNGYETSEGCPYCFYPDNAFKKLKPREQYLGNASNAEDRLFPASAGR
jgi:rubrerythrin